MKITKVAAKKFMVVFSIALIISLSIPHVSLWGFGLGADAGKAETQKNPSDYTNCPDCLNKDNKWCTTQSNPSNQNGVCIEKTTRVCPVDYPRPYSGSTCPPSDSTTTTSTQRKPDETMCQWCMRKGEKYCKQIQTGYSSSFNVGYCRENCNVPYEEEYTTCPPPPTCSSICFNYMFYRNLMFSGGSSQQLSMPIGQCSREMPLYLAGSAFGQQSAGGISAMPQPTGAFGPDVGDCNLGEQCWCINLNMAQFNQNTAATNYPSATIPGRTQTANWKNPKEKKNPPRTAIDNYNGIATSGRISARIEQELFQAGDKITIKGSVDKMCSTCDGWKYTCEAFNEIQCKVKNKLLGFQLKYEYPKCPADIPDILYEEGEKTFTKWKKVLDAALAIYMIKNSDKLFQGSGSSSIMNNPYMLQIIAQQSGANINPYMLSIIMQSMQTTGRVVGDESLLPVTGMAVDTKDTIACGQETDSWSICGQYGAKYKKYVCRSSENAWKPYGNEYNEIRDCINSCKNDLKCLYNTNKARADMTRKNIVDGKECSSNIGQAFCCKSIDADNKYDMCICTSSGWFREPIKKTLEACEINCATKYSSNCIFKTETTETRTTPGAGSGTGSSSGSGTEQTLQPGQFIYLGHTYTLQFNGLIRKDDGTLINRDDRGYFYDANNNGRRDSGESMSSTFNTLAANAATTGVSPPVTGTDCNSICKSFGYSSGGVCLDSCLLEDFDIGNYNFTYCSDKSKSCCCKGTGTPLLLPTTCEGCTAEGTGYIWCTATKEYSSIGECSTYLSGCPQNKQYAHYGCKESAEGFHFPPVKTKDQKSAEESKGMSFQQIMLLYFVLRMILPDPPTDHVCYRVCGEQYNTQAGKAPVCSKMISTVSGVSEVVIGYQNATYTCQQGYCGKWANKEIKIEIYSPTGNFITAYTTKTDGKGGFSYTFAAPHVDGEFTAVVSIPGAGLSQATQNIPEMIF